MSHVAATYGKALGIAVGAAQAAGGSLACDPSTGPLSGPRRLRR